MRDVLWIITELAATLCEAFLAIYFIISSFNNKCKTLNIKATYLIGTVGMAAVVSLLNNFTLYEGILGFIYFVCFFAFAFVFLHGSILKKLFISILTNVCLISVALIVGNALTIFTKNEPMKIYSEHCIERFLYIVISMAVLAYIFKILLNFTGGGRELLQVKEWVLILSVLGISFFVIAVIHITMLDGEINNHNGLLMVSELGIVIINILCLYITTNLNETHKREEKLLLEKRQSEYSQKYAEAVRTQYQEIRGIRHDMKQHLAAIGGLQREGKYDAATKYVRDISNSIEQLEMFMDVGNDFVNAILNSKLSIAKTKGIEVLCNSSSVVDGVNEYDLCNLIGNILDNAIEAAEKTDNAVVEVSILSDKHKLMITVANSISQLVLSGNSTLKTTKSESELHGFGVKSIRAIAEKYNGSVDFYEEDMTFFCRVILGKNV